MQVSAAQPVRVPQTAAQHESEGLYEISLSQAKSWYLMWGEEMRCRALGGRSLANPWRGQYRRRDDPKPLSFVAIQVERCLNGMPTDLERAFVRHFYVEEKGIELFSHPDLPGGHLTQYRYGRLRNRVLRRLARQLGARRPETIEEAAVMQVMRRRRGSYRTR